MGGFVLRRLRAHRLLVAAALLTILLTAAAVSTLAAFSPAVATAGVQRAFQVTDRSQTPLLMTESTGRSGLDSARAAASATAHSAFRQLPVTLRQLAVSDSYGLPLRHGQSAQTADLTLLADLDPSRVRLVSGAWPTSTRVGTPAGAPVDVAVPTAAVARLGGVGTVLNLTDRYGSAVDLGPLVGSLDGTAVVTHASPALQLLPVVLPAAVLLVLAVAVVLAEAAVIGRRQIGVQLRAGDEA